MSHVITATGLTVSRGPNRHRRTIIGPLSFTVPPGCISGVVGPSGAGKTTLIRAITGLQPHQGELVVLGRRAGHPANRGRIGYDPQEVAVHPGLSAREHCRYYGTLGHDSVPSREVIDELLEVLGLAEVAEVRTDGLSGGQRKRVSLACALISRAKLLVIDEPTVGLDPLTREHLWNHFRSLAAEGVTFLLSSHVLEEADRCDRVLMLRQGELIADETPTELRHRTGCPDLESAFLKLVRECSGSSGEGWKR
ncbi:ABC transporter ATP-binding protein [Corynebacterium antarcticum]|uniref:ABC transporter ATP-binding protein n=1 Tax=Corynebacterium antarcticum TaxID=2800405 RepID=UPI002260A8DA|nr:ABC transporter ATP-binding protein [Corynebacterium antarcticum]MCX7491035.1 ABC transporter ATP-binding protein [Corynebacterium antarcticum]MCX7539778.1 ABC transporter ATP-binding protein [Corynebacterium antarcticum]